MATLSERIRLRHTPPVTSGRYHERVLKRYGPGRAWHLAWMSVWLTLAAGVSLVFVWYYGPIMHWRHGDKAIIAYGITQFSLGTLAFMDLHNAALVVINALYRRVMDEQLVVNQAYLEQLYGFQGPRSWKDPVLPPRVPRDEDVANLSFEAGADEPWEGLAHLRWAGHRASWERLGMALADAREIIGAPLLIGRPCGDCGHPHAPIQCSACGSVQWADLERERLQVAMPAWNYQQAAVISKYRRELFAGVLSSLFAFTTATAGSSFYAYKQNEAQQLQQYTHAADEFIESSFGYRAALAQFEAVCEGSVHGPTLDDDAMTTQCMDLFRQFQDHYYRFSWYGTPLLARLRERSCASPQHELQRLACAHLTPERVDIVDQVDDRFRAYLASQRVGNAEERRLNAVNLYYHGRIVGCVVGALAWYDDTTPFANRNFESCLVVMEADFEPFTSDDIPDCRGDHETRLLTWCRR